MVSSPHPELRPRVRLEQLAQVCLACQETIQQWFSTRDWSLPDRKCADASAVEVDRRYHQSEEHDARISELWQRVLAAPQPSPVRRLLHIPRLLFRSQH
jgi:hypothetical protein